MMFQPHLFELPPDASKPINVASVPQRSPFRYPGGKTWLVPYIRSWLSQANQKPKEFIEPFVGGGIISLTVAAEHLAEHVVMMELDEDVSSEVGWLVTSSLVGFSELGLDVATPSLVGGSELVLLDVVICVVIGGSVLVLPFIHT